MSQCVCIEGCGRFCQLPLFYERGVVPQTVVQLPVVHLLYLYVCPRVPYTPFLCGGKYVAAVKGFQECAQFIVVGINFHRYRG